MYSADAQCTLKALNGREEAQTAEKKNMCLNISCLTHNKMFNIIIREMQIKTTTRYHLTPVRMTIIKKSTNNKCGKSVDKNECSCTVRGNVD